MSMLVGGFNVEDMYAPKFLVNNNHEKIKVGHEINEILKDCDSFYFSVAFINVNGLAVLKQSLLELLLNWATVINHIKQFEFKEAYQPEDI